MSLFLKRVWIYVFLLQLIAGSHAQGDSHFEKLSSENGAYQSIIYALAQDSFGNIWSSSENGVIRFNSHEAYLYNKYEGLPRNFGNRVSTIYLDPAHRLWIGGENGIARYEAKMDSFVWIPFERQRGPILVKAILADQQGKILIGGYNGLWVYEPEGERSTARFQQLLNARGVESLLLHGSNLLIGSADGLLCWDSQRKTANTLSQAARGVQPFTAMCMHRYEGQLLLGSKGQGLFRLSPDLQQIRHIDLPIFRNRNYPIHDLLSRPDGRLYMATDGLGLLLIDKDLRLIESYDNDVNDPGSISSNGVYDLLEGAEEILWVATYGGGINFLDPAKNRFHTITHQINTSQSIAHPFSRSVLEDSEGNIWFGTKAGISIWHKKLNQWKHIRDLTDRNSPDAAPYIIMALEEDGDYIWAGTYNGGAYRIHKQQLAKLNIGPGAPAGRQMELSKVYAIRKDQTGNIWMGGIDQQLYCLLTDGTLRQFPVSQVKVIQNASGGGIWVAGRNGVHHIFGEQVTEIEDLLSGRNGLDYATINCLQENRKGQLIVGTNGEGLLIYQPTDRQLHQISLKEGLPSDIIQGILVEDDNNLWLSTVRGLAHIQFSAGDTSIRVFDKSDGLISTEFNYGSYTRLKDGQMIFGGVDGLTMFNPKEISEQQALPAIVFEELRVLNQEVGPGEAPLQAHINATDHLKLTYWENALSLRFVGILHSTPNKIRYTWMLGGFDEQWSEPSFENQTNFTNLAPGDYTFRVKAANREGKWGPERQLRISISPPWYASNIAIISYILLGIIALVVSVYILNIIVTKRNAEQQIDFFNNITHELKTPLTILLSSLDKLPKKEHSHRDSEQKIRTTVTRLNALFEQLLNFHRATADKQMGKEIRKIQLKEYIASQIESVEPLLSEKNLSIQTQCHWKKEVFYFNTEVFDKILFNLISNAIKYSREGGTITLVLKEGKKNRLKLSVSDQGIGIPEDQQKYILRRYYRGRNAINSQLPGTGLGLIMVKNLVEKHGGEISFKSVENEGTTFFVSLKNQEEAYHKSALAETKSGAAQAEALYEGVRLEELGEAKILVVEDNDELRQLLVKRLSHYFQVMEASNGREGLAKTAEFFPDLIITDLIMPEMDGLAMAKAIMQDINLNHIPIFMLTVLNNSSQKLESIETGITEYMEKPIDINLLLAKIANTLSWQAKLQKKYQHETEIENAQTFRNQRDADFINSLEKFTLEHITEEQFSVNNLCEYVGMSRTSLYMKLKNLVDMSPQDFIINTRLKYARQLLIRGHGSIKEIAYDSGFSNPKYFSTSFKKQFGLSPSQFLESLEKDN